MGQTKAVEIELRNVWTDKYGAIYTPDRKRLLKVPDCNHYEILEGTEAIGLRAFRECLSLRSVIIPNTVTSMEMSAFGLCRALESCVIPESITEIAKGAFLGCTSLKSVFLPKTLTQIGAGAFHNCVALERIDIPASVTWIGIPAFSNCKCEIVCHGDRYHVVDKVLYGHEGICLMHCSTDATEVRILDSVGNVADKAFCGCSSLHTIIFPHALYFFDRYIYGYDSLKHIIIPKGTRSFFEKELPSQLKELIEEREL